MELCWTRRPGFAGPLPLEYQEIEAWGRLTRRTLGQLELKLLLEMDTAYVRALSEKSKDEGNNPDIIDVEEQGLTPDLFDALFVANNNDNVLRSAPDG